MLLYSFMSDELPVDETVPDLCDAPKSLLLKTGLLQVYCVRAPSLTLLISAGGPRVKMSDSAQARADMIS